MIIKNKSFKNFIYTVLDNEKKTKISLIQSFWINFVRYNLQRNRKEN